MMTTLQTSVEVTEERRLRLDIRLPEDLPTGYADVRIHIVPSNEGKDAPSISIMDFFVAFKGENAFGGDSVEIIRGIRDEW